MEGAAGRGAGRAGAGQARRRARRSPSPVLHPAEPQVTVGARLPGPRRGDRRHRGRRRRPAGDDRRPRPARAAQHAAPACWRSTSSTCARRRSTVEDGYGDRRCSPSARGSAARRCRRSWPTACAAALEGTLPLAERLRQREADYRQDGARSAPPRISWHNGEVSGAATGIVEVRAADRAGLLYRLTAALAGEGLDVHLGPRSRPSAPTPSTAFYVCNPSGDAGRRRAARAGRRRRWWPPTRGRRRAEARPRGATRRAEFRGPVGSPCDGRGDRDGTVPPVREELRGQPPVALPAVRRDRASSCSRRAPTGTPTTAASARSGPAPTAAPPS